MKIIVRITLTPDEPSRTERALQNCEREVRHAKYS